MKIIKEGKVKNKLVRTTCRECKSVLEESEDKLKWEYDPRDQSRLACKTCPLCRAEIFFY
jgi:hypothetical protein